MAPEARVGRLLGQLLTRVYEMPHTTRNPFPEGGFGFGEDESIVSINTVNGEKFRLQHIESSERKKLICGPITAKKLKEEGIEIEFLDPKDATNSDPTQHNQ